MGSFFTILVQAQGFWILVSVVVAFFIAQLSKSFWIKPKSFYDLFFRSGGMPSSHTAPITALAGSIFIVEGLSTSFVIAFILMIVVMRDALGVRFATGRNARVLKRFIGKNKLSKDVVLVDGHTPLQVFTGFLIGLAVTFIVGLVL